MPATDSSPHETTTAAISPWKITVNLATLIVPIAWIGFWLMIATLHYQQGDLLASGVTGIGLTLPALVFLTLRLVRHR